MRRSMGSNETQQSKPFLFIITYIDDTVWWTLAIPIHLSARPLPCGVKKSLALSECNLSMGGLEPPVSAKHDWRQGNTTEA